MKLKVRRRTNATTTSIPRAALLPLPTTADWPRYAPTATVPAALYTIPATLLATYAAWYVFATAVAKEA